MYLQRIAAVVALEKPGPAGSGDGGSKGSSSSSSGLELAELRQWAADRLPPYQLPAELRVVPATPRNAMGKVNKKELRLQLFGGGGSA
jgi:malonyl-CoA/methylmalonyl-CoA synthetase